MCLSHYLPSVMCLRISFRTWRACTVMFLSHFLPYVMCLRISYRTWRACRIPPGRDAFVVFIPYVICLSYSSRTRCLCCIHPVRDVLVVFLPYVMCLSHLPNTKLYCSDVSNLRSPDLTSTIRCYKSVTSNVLNCEFSTVTERLLGLQEIDAPSHLLLFGSLLKDLGREFSIRHTIEAFLKFWSSAMHVQCLPWLNFLRRQYIFIH